MSDRPSTLPDPLSVSRRTLCQQGPAILVLILGVALTIFIRVRIAPAPVSVSDSTGLVAGGILLSLLAAAYLRQVLARSCDARREAQEQTEALAWANRELARQITLKDDALEEVLKLTRAVECSPIGVVIAQPDGLIDYVNQKCVELTGYEKSEMVGRRTRVLDAGGLDENAQQEIRKRLAQGEDWQGGISYEKKNGELANFDLSIAPILTGDQETGSLVAMFSDATGRKRLEEQFLQAQKMEVIGRLTGGVVHDLNNMLTVILGLSQLVRSQLAEDNPLMADMEEIIRVGQQAGDLNRQLLSISRTRSAEAVWVDLNDTLVEMDRFLIRTLGEDVELKTLPSAEVGCIKIDPGQISQLIMNLAVNARDAMPLGGKLTIKIRNADPSPQLRTLFELQSQDYVMLSVRDTGTGMSEEVRRYLFEPFFTTKDEGKGTGLGLSTVYGIVKQFDGAIEVESEVGRGTEFKVYFPLCGKQAEPETNPEKRETPRGTESLLLVEDDRDVRQLSVALLKSLGYRVIEAKSGVDALELAMRASTVFDLLLTDVIMPELNGIELVNRLRKIRPDLKVIITTGFSEHPILNTGIVLENSWMLPKPFTRDSLSRIVREAIDTPPRKPSAQPALSVPN